MSDLEFYCQYKRTNDELFEISPLLPKHNSYSNTIILEFVLPPGIVEYFKKTGHVLNCYEFISNYALNHMSNNIFSINGNDLNIWMSSLKQSQLQHRVALPVVPYGNLLTTWTDFMIHCKFQALPSLSVEYLALKEFPHVDRDIASMMIKYVPHTYELPLAVNLYLVKLSPQLSLQGNFDLKITQPCFMISLVDNQQPIPSDLIKIYTYGRYCTQQLIVTVPKILKVKYIYLQTVNNANEELTDPTLNKWSYIKQRNSDIFINTFCKIEHKIEPIPIGQTFQVTEPMNLHMYRELYLFLKLSEPTYLEKENLNISITALCKNIALYRNNCLAIGHCLY